jgi:predicted nuclease of predicted toxin-antitoxin system
MRVLVDENLPRSLARRLCEAGHDAVDLRDLGRGGASDTEVLAIAVKQDRVVVSANHKHFGNVLLFPPAQSRGIVVVRMPKCSIKTVMTRIENVLASLSESHVRGSLIIVDASHVRRRT